MLVTLFIITLSEITYRLAKTSLPVQVHDWVVYRLGVILGSVGHKVKIHKITPATGKERGDLEIKNYVVLQKPQKQTDHLPPSRTQIVDFTLTQTQYGRSHVHSIGQLTNTRRSDGAPEPDGALREVTRKKILHYRQLYLDRPEPMTFMSTTVDTSDRIYDDFLRLVFLHAHREASALAHEVPEESGQFRFLRGFPYRLICHLGPLYHYRISFALGDLHQF